MFRKTAHKAPVGVGDFGYLSDDVIYFDSACQSLRPQPVIDAMNEYYTRFNSCGDRVKYQWGQEVDERVEATRSKTLKMLKLSPKKYFVSFTVNTTYGLNLILNQLKPEGIRRVITSDIEHNSPFLSTITFSRRHNIPREVLVRNNDGSIDLDAADFSDSVVVLNAVSNIDGRRLENIQKLAAKVRAQKGIFIIDAAQAIAFDFDILAGIEADVICFSSHKMYGPSLGVMVVRKDLLDQIDISFIGGGMVDDATYDDYALSSKSPDHIHTAFEPGLLPYAEVIGLGAAIDWLLSARKTGGKEKTLAQSQKLFDFLDASPRIRLINNAVSPVLIFHHESLDSHLLAEALSGQNIMVRSGYFCCHYYLDHVKHYPPLVRVSLGLHNSESDIDKLIEALQKVAQ